MFKCKRCEWNFNLLGRDKEGWECCPFCGSRSIVFDFDDETEEE